MLENYGNCIAGFVNLIKIRSSIRSSFFLSCSDKKKEERIEDLILIRLFIPVVYTECLIQ